MNVYPDTSFLVSLYYLDAHSAEAQRRVQRPSLSLFLTPFIEVELTNALHSRIFRGDASAAEIRASMSAFENDIRTGTFALVPMPAETYQLARRILASKTPTLRVRTLDILHIASAALLKADRFWTFDTRQTRLARAEGLQLR